jgi:formate-dependent nitrite reductase membrane component NrfD
MVPDAEFRSYYGRPVLHKPTWAATDIAGYLFLGGLAGASSVLAAAADLTGRPALARTGKLGAAVALGGSLYALVHDLGRPARFVNMLRVFKPSSPMSVGSWLLAGYGPQAALAAATAVTGKLPRLGRVATLGAGLAGPAVAAYTGVLIADTAIPVWHDAYRELPFLFVGSAAGAAGGLGLIGTPTAQAAPARRAVVFGAALDLAATKRMHDRLGAGGGIVGEPLRQGTAGRLLRAGQALTVTGAVVGGLLGRRSRVAAVVGGVAALAGSACTRFGIFHAGVASAQDPKYTVVPQRERR